MEFSGDIAAWQRRVAGDPEAGAWRAEVLEAAAPAPGERVLDIGCGGGAMLRKIALAVGAAGRAAGIDLSAEQVAAARALCADLAQVDVVQGDAADLPFADGGFDAVISCNTLDYVPDAGRALSEARRVLRRGARAVLSSMLWDHCRFHGAAPALDARILGAWRAHCPHQSLPLELPALLKAAGFGDVVRQPQTTMQFAFGEDSFCHWIARIFAAFAASQGISEAEAARWLDQLSEAERDGRFAYVSLSVLTLARVA